MVKILVISKCLDIHLYLTRQEIKLINTGDRQIYSLETESEQSQIDIVVKLIKEQQKYREIIQRKYSTDYSIIIDMLLSKFGVVVNKFYAYLDKHNIETDENDMEIIQGFSDNTDFSNKEIDDLAEHYNLKDKYSDLFGVLWNRCFESKFEEISEDSLRFLAQNEIDSGCVWFQ